MKIGWVDMLFDLVDAMLIYLLFLFGMIVGFFTGSFWTIIAAYFSAVLFQIIYWRIKNDN